MSRVVRVHLIAPSAVRERSECLYLRATAQDSVLSRGRSLPAKRAAKHLEQALWGPIRSRDRLEALRVKLACLNWEPRGFAPARSTAETVAFQPVGTCTLSCK